jgi:hypothetical protein
MLASSHSSHWFARVGTIKQKLSRLRSTPPVVHSVPVTELRCGDRFWHGGNLLRVRETVQDDQFLEVRSSCGDVDMNPMFLPFETVVVALPRPAP